MSCLLVQISNKKTSWRPVFIELKLFWVQSGEIICVEIDKNPLFACSKQMEIIMCDWRVWLHVVFCLCRRKAGLSEWLTHRTTHQLTDGICDKVIGPEDYKSLYAQYRPGSLLSFSIVFGWDLSIFIPRAGKSCVFSLKIPIVQTVNVCMGLIRSEN